MVRRLTRSRVRGWCKPPNSVYVGRPSKWGNPIIIIGDLLFIDASYRRKILDPYVVLDDYAADEKTLYKRMLQYYEGILRGGKFDNPDLQYWSDKFKQNNIEELKGKNLLCWCKQGKPCHGDILLKIANE